MQRRRWTISHEAARGFARLSQLTWIPSSHNYVDTVGWISRELWLIGGFGLTFYNDVWRSSDGKDWRPGFTHDIVVP